MDVDHIIRQYSLAEIYKYAEEARYNAENAIDPERKTFHEQQEKEMKFAYQLSEFCIENDIPTNDIYPDKEEPGYRVLEIIEKLRQLENNVKYLTQKGKSYNEPF